MPDRTQVTVNAIDFFFEERCGGDIVDVYDAAGVLTLDLEKDFGSEQIYGTVFSAENGAEHTFEASLFDFRDKPVSELVEWAIETQLFG